MTIKIKLGVCAISYILLVYGCTVSEKKITPESSSLKETFKSNFLIGTALNAEQIEEKDSVAAMLVQREFSSITAENSMKCEIIHPAWDRYDFNIADKFVAYGRQHHMFIVGHNLIWHSQLSPFVSKIKTRDSLLLFMTNHINTIAGRYTGKVDGWDVVNEALNEDGTMRNSIFLEKIGEGYVTKAFELAAKASPNTEMYYNDYNIEQPMKRAGAISLIKKIQAAGVRIDGVGIQGHWSINNLPVEDLEKAIVEFAALGLKVMITELDLTVLPNPWDLKGADVNQNFEGNKAMNPYPKNLPDSLDVKLTQSYESLFRIFLKHTKKISRVTFWGVGDGQSWLNHWPIKNRTNYPLLFDRNFNKKSAYKKIIELKEKN